jgi:hypothetical protein
MREVGRTTLILAQVNFNLILVAYFSAHLGGTISGDNIINYGRFHVNYGLNCAGKKIYKLMDKSTDIYVLKR